MPDRRLASMFAPRSTAAPATAASIVMLTGYAGDLGGLSTFAAGLRGGLLADRPDLAVDIVQAAGGQGAGDSPEIVHRLVVGVDGSREASAVINRADAAILHYQAGVYGGVEGDQIVDVLQWITKPVVAVIQDVHQEPTARERFIIEVLASSADAVVTLSETGRRILLDDYQVEPRKLMAISHGARLSVSTVPAAPEQRPNRRPNVLTWGVLGPDRGVEMGMQSLALTGALQPAPRYTIAGPLDPALSPAEAANYRRHLVDTARDLGLADRIEFHFGRLETPRLASLVHNADVVLLTPTLGDPTASSILVDAIAAGRPVVCTTFPFAQEVLADNLGGHLVAYGDPDSAAAALTQVLLDPVSARTMATQNAASGSTLSWRESASRYRQLIDALMRRPPTR